MTGTGLSQQGARSTGALRNGRRPWAARVGIYVLLLAGGLAVGLLACEAAIRLLPRRWVPELASYEERAFYLGSLVRPSKNPELYFEVVPNNAKVGANSAGYRGPLYPESKPEGVRRIVGIGDSCLWGWGVSEEEGCLRQLESLLAEATSAPVQAVNLAVPGYNSKQELEQFRVRGLRFAPDLVVVGYNHNDMHRTIGNATHPLLVPDDYGRNPLGSELWRYVRRKLYAMQLSRLHRNPGGHTVFEGHPVSGPLWEQHLEALAEIARLARERGAPVVAVTFDAWIQRDPDRTSEHYRELHEPMAPFWQRHGFHVVECYDLFQDYMATHGLEDVSSLWVSIERRDGHPNAKAHRMVAEALLELIEREGLVR